MSEKMILPSWAALAMAMGPRLVAEGRDHDAMMTEAPWAIPARGDHDPSWAIAVSRRPEDVHGVVWMRGNLGTLLDCCQAAMGEVDRLRAELELARLAAVAGPKVPAKPAGALVWKRPRHGYYRSGIYEVRRDKPTDQWRIIMDGRHHDAVILLTHAKQICQRDHDRGDRADRAGADSPSPGGAGP